MKSALKTTQTGFRQIVFLYKLIIVVTPDASQSDLGSINLRLFVLRGADVVFAVTIGADRNFANTQSESLTVNPFPIVFQNSAMALAAGIRYSTFRNQ